MKKRALITGITGQDGSYLAEFLLGKGYEVHGVIRRSSSFNTSRIEHLYMEDLVRDIHTKKIQLHYGDLGDATGLIRLIGEAKAQGHEAVFCKGGDRNAGNIPEMTVLNKHGAKLIDGLGAKIDSSSRIIAGAKKPSA